MLRYKETILLIVIITMSSIVLNIELNKNEYNNSQRKETKDIGNEILMNSDLFDPDPLGIHTGKYWNFTTGEIVGWRVSTDRYARDMIFNITDLKFFTAAENVTGNSASYYGVQLTPAYWNISTNKVMEFTNRTVFPLLNASLINYTLPKAFGVFSIDNLKIFGAQNEQDGGPEYLINLFVPKNNSHDLDLLWVADALHWLISMYLNGIFIGNYLLPPQTPSQLCDLSITSNSIHYSNPTKGTYCNLYYYDNGTLETGELKGYFMPDMTLTINWTRIFDFNPLDNIKWSESFNTFGEELFIGMDHNETYLQFNHTKNNMALEIKWDDESGWEHELFYWQDLWANVSYWDNENKKWQYINTTVVARANDLYPIVFGGGDDEDEEEDGFILPSFLLIPDEGTAYSPGDVFKLWEFNPEWDDLLIESQKNWVKLTNTTSHNIVVFSYQDDGVLEYIYLQELGPFTDINEERNDIDLMFYYKNRTVISSPFDTFSLHTFDIKISAVVNVTSTQSTQIFHSGFPYNPTNQSIGNALGFFDIFLTNEEDLDQTNFSPINITFHYDNTKYKSVKIYLYNFTGNNNYGAWDEITIKDLGKGLIVITLTNSSFIVFTAVPITNIIPSDDDGDDDDDDENPAIPFGNYYLVFIAFAIIGLILYKKRNIFKN